MKKVYAILNALIILIVIGWNYFTNTSSINGNTVASVSDKYENLFTPAGFTFAIWGVIFLGLLLLAGFLIKTAFSESDDSDFILTIGPWLAMANIANCIWLIAWLNEKLPLSVLIMSMLLFCLLTIISRLHINRIKFSNSFNVFFNIPISIYAGWISVALIANIAACITQLDFNMGPTEEIWAIIMIIIACVVNLYMVHFRNSWSFGMVGVWALFGIAMQHWDTIQSIKVVAIVGALTILGAILSQVKSRLKSI